MGGDKTRIWKLGTNKIDMRFIVFLILVPIIGSAQVEQVKWDTVFTNNYGLYFEPNNHDIYYHDGTFKKYSKEGKFVDGVDPLDAIYMGDVGIGTGTPDAKLDIQGTDGGVLIPRLSTANLLSVIGDESELIYNTDDDQFQYWDGTGWIPLITGATAIPVGMTLNTVLSEEPDFTVANLTSNVIATHVITPDHVGEELIYTVSGSIRWTPVGTNAALVFSVLLDGVLVTTVNMANANSSVDLLMGNTYIYNGSIPITSTSHTVIISIGEGGSGISGVNTFDNQIKYTEVHRTGTKTF